MNTFMYMYLYILTCTCTRYIHLNDVSWQRMGVQQAQTHSTHLLWGYTYLLWLHAQG